MRRSNRAITWIATAAAAVGITVGVAGLAGAATSGSSGSGTTATTPATPATPQAHPANAPDPATVDHGPGETVLTGDAAAKVTAAAKAAVPGATIIRVETDSDGSAYEAHTQKSDGSFVTIKLDKSFKVTATDSGFGGGPGGHHGDGDGDGPGAPGTSSSAGTTGA